MENSNLSDEELVHQPSELYPKEDYKGVCYSNEKGVNPLLGLLVAYSEYDHNDDPSAISATSLMKPTRMVALERIYRYAPKVVDVSDLVNSGVGNALHLTLEKAIDKTDSDKFYRITGIRKEDIEIRQEVRQSRKVGDFIVSGKYDLLMKLKNQNTYTLGDLKTMKTFGITKDRDAKILEWVKQLSIYRYLNTEKDVVIGDQAIILVLYTDWSPMYTKQPNYPQHKLDAITVKLWDKETTEKYITGQLDAIKKAIVNYFKQGDVGVLCSAEDLWKSDDVYKVYLLNSKTKTYNESRASKVFSSLEDANNYITANGSKHPKLKHELGKVKRCAYCSVRGFCNQYSQLLQTNQI